MTGQLIPVPESLIERAKDALLEVPPSSGNADIYGELHALLSQSTPSTEHDHTGQPKVWCTRCQHEHIAAIPATTYECDSCGFAQWDLGTARLHEAQQDGHRAYPIAHPTVPLDERPAVPTAAGVLFEVVTRIDEARYANGDGGSPWANTDVLGLLAHLRQPYTEGGATAEAECGVRHPDFPAITSSCTQPLGHDGPHVSIDDYIQWEATRA